MLPVLLHHTQAPPTHTPTHTSHSTHIHTYTLTHTCSTHTLSHTHTHNTHSQHTQHTHVAHTYTVTHSHTQHTQHTHTNALPTLPVNAVPLPCHPSIQVNSVLDSFVTTTSDLQTEPLDPTQPVLTYTTVRDLW